MGRPAKITYEQVVAVAEELKKETGKWPVDIIRQRLGDQGSKSTILAHLKTWEAGFPQPASLALEELPQDVARTLSMWVRQVATAERAHTEEQLATEEERLNSMIVENQRLELDGEALRGEITDLTRQRDQAIATTEAMQKEIARMVGEVDRERTLAGKAQTEAAEARLEVKSNAQHLVDAKTEIGRLGALLDAERKALSAAKTAAAVSDTELKNARRDADAERARADGLQGRLDQVNAAERALRDELGQQLQQVAALTAELDASKKSGAEAAERIKALQAQLDQAHQDSSAMHAADQARIERLEDALRADVAAARADTDKARTEMQVALLEAADLRAKLAVAEERAARLEEKGKKGSAEG